MDVEFCSKEQQQLIEYLTPKLSEEELKHVAFLLTQHNLENYTVGFTKASIRNTHPFFTTKECIDILEELDSDDWCWSYVQEALDQYLYVPTAYLEYLNEFIKQYAIPSIIWDNLWKGTSIDTEKLIEDLISDLDQTMVFEFKRTANPKYKQTIFNSVKSIVIDEIVGCWSCCPANLIKLVKDTNNLTDDDISAVNQFLNDYYHLSNIEIAKLWTEL